jgi:hypothetical protein
VSEHIRTQFMVGFKVSVRVRVRTLGPSLWLELKLGSWGNSLRKFSVSISPTLNPNFNPNPIDIERLSLPHVFISIGGVAFQIGDVCR